MHCKACGCEVAEQASFCPHCGAVPRIGYGVALFDPHTGRALNRCGDCRRCKYRANCSRHRRSTTR